jgi:hypothetical protein
MNITELLERLKAAPVNARIAETRKLEDGTMIYLLVAHLPEFPFGREKFVWYPLAMEPGQTLVDRDEIRAILARFWHSGVDFFGDDLCEPTLN